MFVVHHWNASKQKSIVPTEYDKLMFSFKVEKNNENNKQTSDESDEFSRIKARMKISSILN